MTSGEFGDPTELVVHSQIERRFRLVDTEVLPSREELDALYTSVILEQGYLETSDEQEIRLRIINAESLVMTYKSGSGINRPWKERTVGQAEFDELWPQTEGSRVRKTRYYIPVGQSDDKYVELDFFEGELTDFVLAEVKFGDLGEAALFEVPEWMTKAGCLEVTDIAAFQNRNLSRYQSFKPYVEAFSPEERGLPTIDPEKAPEVFSMFLDATKHIYGMYRREERQIFGNSSGHGPQETDAEHSWHVNHLLDLLWENRAALGVDFGEGFDIALAMQQAPVHDLPEIWARDVDAVTKKSSLLANKEVRELEAIGLMVAAHPYLGRIAIRALEYAQKKTPEAKLVSDLDKFAGILMIVCDDGKKWREQVGNTTSRSRHDQIINHKFLTPFGQAVRDECLRFFDAHPELFAHDTVRPLIHDRA